MSAVLLERDGPVARITLNRAEVGNAIDMALGRALVDAAFECDADDSIRCVTLTGAGRMFCAGGDVAVMAAAGDKCGQVVGELAGMLHMAQARFARMNKPLITLVNGPAAGAGYGLALSGDMVIAARSAVFNAAYSALGVSPDGGLTWLLPRLVGLRRAQEIIIGNRRVTAEEAEAMGMITRVVDDAELAAEGAAMAAKLAAGPTGALSTMRSLLLGAFDNGWETHLELETRGIARNVASPDGREGVAAFLAKRKPGFTGAR